jgi:hypothetical protein
MRRKSKPYPKASPITRKSGSYLGVGVGKIVLVGNVVVFITFAEGLELRSLTLSQISFFRLKCDELFDCRAICIE